MGLTNIFNDPLRKRPGWMVMESTLPPSMQMPFGNTIGPLGGTQSLPLANSLVNNNANTITSQAEATNQPPASPMQEIADLLNQNPNMRLSSSNRQSENFQKTWRRSEETPYYYNQEEFEKEKQYADEIMGYNRQYIDQVNKAREAYAKIGQQAIKSLAAKQGHSVKDIESQLGVKIDELSPEETQGVLHYIQSSLAPGTVTDAFGRVSTPAMVTSPPILDPSKTKTPPDLQQRVVTLTSSSSEGSGYGYTQFERNSGGLGGGGSKRTKNFSPMVLYVQDGKVTTKRLGRGSNEYTANIVRWLFGADLLETAPVNSNLFNQYISMSDLYEEGGVYGQGWSNKLINAYPKFKSILQRGYYGKQGGKNYIDAGTSDTLHGNIIRLLSAAVEKEKDSSGKWKFKLADWAKNPGNIKDPLERSIAEMAKAIHSVGGFKWGPQGVVVVDLSNAPGMYVDPNQRTQISDAGVQRVNTISQKLQYLASKLLDKRLVKGFSSKDFYPDESNQGFGLTFANDVLYRLINPKQFVGSGDGTMYRFDATGWSQ